jgi:hypothetical protein
VKPPLRKRVAWAVLVLLAPLSFASLVGSCALVLEREAGIPIRRAPSPIMKSWKDARGNAVAIVNTDTTPGSFLLGFEAPDKPRKRFPSEIIDRHGFSARDGLPVHGGEARVWVPARSIVLRANPKLANREYTVWLYGPHGSIGCFEDWSFRRAVPRGTRVTLTWEPYSNEEWNESLPPDEFYLTESLAGERGALHVATRPGVASRPARPGVGNEWFTWDGRTPVAIDIDTATTPEIADVFAVACRTGCSVGKSEHLWAYPPDMEIIDERESVDTK